MRDYISTAEAAKKMKVSRVAVFNMIKDGRLSAKRIGRNYAISKKEFNQTYLQNLQRSVDAVLKSIDIVEYYLGRFKKAEFFSTVAIQDAFIWRIQVVGWSLKKIPLPIKRQHADWQEWITAANRYLRFYWKINTHEIWKTATKKIKPLKKQLLQIKKDLEKDQT